MCVGYDLDEDYHDDDDDVQDASISVQYSACICRAMSTRSPSLLFSVRVTSYCCELVAKRPRMRANALTVNY